MKHKIKKILVSFIGLCSGHKIKDLPLDSKKTQSFVDLIIWSDKKIKLEGEYDFLDVNLFFKEMLKNWDIEDVRKISENITNPEKRFEVQKEIGLSDDEYNSYINNSLVKEERLEQRNTENTRAA